MDYPLNHITSERAERKKEALNSVFLNNSNEDKREWRMDKSDTFSVSNLYNLRRAAPEKGNMFTWLIIKGRIEVISVLFKQTIVDDELALLGVKRETVEHFALECGRTIEILALVEINLNRAVVLGDIYARQKIKSVGFGCNCYVLDDLALDEP